MSSHEGDHDVRAARSAICGYTRERLVVPRSPSQINEANFLIYVSGRAIHVGSVCGSSPSVSGGALGFDAERICKLVNFIGSVSSDISAWMILAVTVVRYLVVCHPIRSKAICGTRTTYNAIWFFLMAAILANSHLFWTLAITEHTEDGRTIIRCNGHNEYV